MAKILTNTWKHIRRSPYQALSAIAVLILTFFVISVFSLGVLGSREVLRYFETRPQVTAFFKDDATAEDIEKLKQQLSTQAFVTSVKFVSKEEALAIYREQNKQDPLLLEMVTADILPASLEVSGISAQVLPQIAEIITGQKGIEEVVYQKDVIAALTVWTKALRLVSLILISFLVLTSILIIVVIIGMKISLRRHELEVMRLLGASNWYIQRPFLLEGILYGVTGAIIAWGLSYLALLYATPFLVSFLGSIPVLPVPILIMLFLLGIEVVFGIVIGSLSSLIAVRRYLR